jgi:DNA polymerase III epsilon subunit-like protein
MAIITIFDTETSGLPTRPSDYKRYANPFTEFNKYDTSRLIEIGYLTYSYDSETRQRVLIEQRSVLVKPDSFQITNSDIHGITHECAETYGYDVADVLLEFMEVVAKTDILVGHNIDFDKNIVCAELVRAGMGKSAQSFMKSRFECTMKTAIQKYNLTRFPTLKSLFEKVCENGEKWTQNHRAMDDTHRAADCYFAMKAN